MENGTHQTKVADKDSRRGRVRVRVSLAWATVGGCTQSILKQETYFYFILSGTVCRTPNNHHPHGVDRFAAPVAFSVSLTLRYMPSKNGSTRRYRNPPGSCSSSRRYTTHSDICATAKNIVTLERVMPLLRELSTISGFQSSPRS